MSPGTSLKSKIDIDQWWANDRHEEHIASEGLSEDGSNDVKLTKITPENTIFAILSFEGPDVYSQAGGLGARVTNLSQALTQMGYVTHLFFVGDPRQNGEEITNEGRLVLHRWCQWISRYYPVSVYDGEYDKLSDFNESLPDYLIEKVIKPAASQDKLVIVLGEEWQTSEAMCRIGERTSSSGLADHVVMFWNANNTFGFDQIHWDCLETASTLTTVSRYMKHLMQGIGLKPLIIPNGIPSSLLYQVDSRACATLRTDLSTDLVLCKVARWDPSKGWDSAIEATARLKASGNNVVLLARGGTDAYGEEVLYRARSLGLKIQEVGRQGDIFSEPSATITNTERADVLNVKSHCPQAFLRKLYHASDAVLANSSHEPFGLVGLEAMAAGGVAYTGGTGEDYAIPFCNSIVLETADPKEIEAYVTFLQRHPASAERLRKAGRRTAKEYTWERVIDILIRKIECQARAQGLLGSPPPFKAAGVETDEPEMDELEMGHLSASGHSVPAAEFQEVYHQVREIKQEAALREKARRFLAEVPTERVFRNHDGRIFRSLPELAAGLAMMSDDTYTYHANARKNDFSAWLSIIVGDEKLARDLRRMRSRSEAASAVSHRVSVLSSRLALIEARDSALVS